MTKPILAYGFAALLIFGFAGLSNAQDKRVRNIIVSAATEIERAIVITETCLEDDAEATAFINVVNGVRDRLGGLLDEDDWSNADRSIIDDHIALARKEQSVDYSCQGTLDDIESARMHLNQANSNLVDGRARLVEELNSLSAP